MALKIAINGFGRIGRTFLRSVLLDRHATSKIEIVAINEGPQHSQNLDLLFKYDTIMREFSETVELKNPHTLSINNHDIKLYAERDPKNLPWKDLDIDWVIEASGYFTTREQASQHLLAGAKKVLITAPSKDADANIVLGMNEETYNHATHNIISMGSCTTNCFALLVKVITENFAFESGLMTTTHAYTNTQVLLDGTCDDPRRARAAAENIVPTDTGADKVIVQLYPHLKGTLQAVAIRVPVPIGSLVDFTFATRDTLTIEHINETFKKYADTSLKNYLSYTRLPLVSSDYSCNKYSAVFDSLLTKSTGKLSKVFAWYDNEYGYSCRLRDFLLHI